MCDMTHLYVSHDSFLCVISKRQSKYRRWYMAHSHVWRDLFIRHLVYPWASRNKDTGTYLICMCDMTRFWGTWGMHARVHTARRIHDSFLCVAWLICMRDMTHFYVWRDWFVCVTWLIHTSDLTHVYLWHASFMGVAWLIYICEIHAKVQTMTLVLDSFLCVTWLIYMYDVTDSNLWRDSFIHVAWLIYISDINALWGGYGQ